MKYVRPFQSFKRHKNMNPESLNEEIIGPIVNFFKNLWKKTTEDMKKILGDDPSAKKVEDWVERNIFNPADDNYIFKQVIADFAKKTEANEQDCLDLIKNILDPETGALGTQGLQPLYDNLLAAFGKDAATLDIVKFYMEYTRNKAIKDYKYAGGPDLKIDPKVPAKIDPKKIILDMKDTTHLPDFKKVILTAAQDNKKRKQLALDWVNKTLVVRLEKYLEVPQTEALERYLQAAGKEMPEEGPEGGYKEGDSVLYKRDNWEKNKAQDVWDKLTDDEKKNPNEGKLKELIDNGSIGIKVIKTVEKDFVRFTDVDWIKNNEDVLGKVEAKAEGQEDLVKTLGEVKTKNPEAIKKISDVANLYKDPDANKDKIAEIDKIMSEGEGE